jgi:hypothetical protein
MNYDLVQKNLTTDGVLLWYSRENNYLCSELSPKKKSIYLIPIILSKTPTYI